MRTIVYIDGFNLYFGCLKKTSYKWLDLYKLFKEYLLDDTTTCLYIKYFTAKIRSQYSDDPQAPFRQNKYLDALTAYSPPDSFEIVYGHFPPAQKKYMRRAQFSEHYPEDSKDRYTVKVLAFEEKQSDVNIAVHMTNDAWLNRFDQAVLCSNDTDLVSILAFLKEYHQTKRIGVVCPIRNKPDPNKQPSQGLIKHADWYKPWISPEHLKNAQLPENIPNTNIRKPEKWY